jgi:plastocyanin
MRNRTARALGIALLATAPVASAGTISGTVPVSGAADADRTVVYVETVPKSSFPADRVRMSQKGARFSPSLLPVVAGSNVDMTNDDWVAHSVFSKSEVEPFDLGLYSPGVAKSVAFDRTGPVEVFCSIHPRMNAVVLVLQNPYFAKPEADGSYSIEGVPPGTYTLKVHKLDGEDATRQVTVAQEPVEVSFSNAD